jgi:hypothetical protein
LLFALYFDIGQLRDNNSIAKAALHNRELLTGFAGSVIVRIEQVVDLFIVNFQEADLELKA